jgi:prepilin-type N-terminal cleavage/methylation domain-containing protein/prepilin-type processing-associated H-X9-DG protein
MQHTYPERTSARGPRAYQPAFHSQAGFTLIELLVVIAIIAILAAILFPVFAQAREKARQTACLSNMKQIGTGIMMYKQDYDETFPAFKLHDTGPFGPSRPYGWGDCFQSYVKSTQIMRCPSTGSPPNSGANPNLAYTDYCINGGLGNGPATGSTGTGTNPPRPVSDAEVTNPSLTVMVAEAQSQHARSQCPGGTNAAVPLPYAFINSNGTAINANGVPQGRLSQHNGGSTFNFADGHAKWYKSETKYYSKSVYERNRPFSVSGNNPTFHYSDGVTLQF